MSEQRGVPKWFIMALLIIYIVIDSISDKKDQWNIVDLQRRIAVLEQHQQRLDLAGPD